MAIIMSSFLVPISPALPFLVEDKMVRGGFRCLDTVADRDKLHPAAKRKGMLVWCADVEQMFQLASDMITWEEANFGGGGGDVNPLDVTFESPIIQATDAEGKVVVGMASHNKIPLAPSPGMMLISGPNGTLQWYDGAGSAQPGTRALIEFEAPAYISPGAEYAFSLEMSKTAILLSVTLNAFDVKLEGFSKPDYSDLNPYTFVSSANLFEDEGISIEDEVMEKKRRYAILSNPSGRTTHYFKFTNMGVAPTVPKVTIKYLALE